MRRNSYTLPDTIAYSSGKKVRVDIPLSGYITHIDCLLTLNVEAGATPSAAQDGLAKIINSARIRAAGAKTYFDVMDGREWLWWAYFNQEGQIQQDTLPDAGSKEVTLILPIHLGFNWYDQFDRTVVIPAREVTNLVMEVDWGTNSDLGTGITIDTDKTNEMKLDISELTLEAGDLREDVFPEGLVSPRMEPRIIDIAAAKANLGQEDEVPVGDTLFQTGIMVLNSSDNRSDSVVSEVGVKFPRRRETPWRRDFDFVKAMSRRHFRTPASVTGASLYPWGWVSGKPLGLDLAAAMVGDCKMGFTTTVASGEIHLLHYAVGSE